MRIIGSSSSGGSKPTTPTIGAATDGGTGTTVSVAFTPSTYIGKGTITYTATSSPGGLTGTGSSSPITVSGLTTGTAYTFTVRGTTNYGVASDSSAASNSVTPVTPTAFDSIATSTPTSGSTVSFTSIPSTYKSLQLRILALSATNSDSRIVLNFNSDTAANYANHGLRGTGASVFSNNEISANYILTNIGGIGTESTQPFVHIIDIIDYANTSKNKTVRNISGKDKNGTGVISLNSGLWISTSAINRIDVKIESAGDTFKTGTSIALYGVK